MVTRCRKPWCSYYRIHSTILGCFKNRVIQLPRGNSWRRRSIGWLRHSKLSTNSPISRGKSQRNSSTSGFCLCAWSLKELVQELAFCLGPDLSAAVCVHLCYTALRTRVYIWSPEPLRAVTSSRRSSLSCVKRGLSGPWAPEPPVTLLSFFVHLSPLPIRSGELREVRSVLILLYFQNLAWPLVHNSSLNKYLIEQMNDGD